MKLNIDGAWKSSTVAGGEGGVFRRPIGSWFVGFSGKFNVHSPLASEQYSLREGLMIAKDFIIDKQKVETDTLNLKVMLGKINEQSHHELGPMLREVAQLLRQNWIKSFSHVSEFYNKVVHSLAAHSLIMVVGHKPHYIIPSCAKADYEIHFEHANPEYVSTVRRNAREKALSIVGVETHNVNALNKIAITSTASQIVFGSIISEIRHVVDSSKDKDSKMMDKGKGEAFSPFVIGG